MSRKSVWLFVLFALAALAVAWMWLRPDMLRVQRSAHVLASRPLVYALVADLKNWERWSPWEYLEPEVQRSYSGPASGVGATYEWRGGGDSGRMRVVEANAPEQVTIALELDDIPKPIIMRMDLLPSDSGTQVTWSMEVPLGSSEWTSRLLVPYERVMGEDLDLGLHNLAREARASAIAPAR